MKNKMMKKMNRKMRKAKIFFYQMSEIIYAGSAWIPNIHNYIANGKWTWVYYWKKNAVHSIIEGEYYC